MKLLERDELLARLHAQWTQACAGPGRLVFVEGEAGIGKSTLLRAFAQSLHGVAPVHWGASEALRTPRPLGPLDDIALVSGAELRALLDSGAQRHRIFVAFVDLLAQRPSLVVLEDLHWADEATLDLLRYAGRRVVHTRSLLVVSFRSDELVPSHPLRAVLGDLATSGAPRLALPPLSLAAVGSLCAQRGLDATELHCKTGGNPFFVTEVLATGEPGVPATVQDAVLARAARLSPSARAVLDAAAVAGPRVEPWLLQELTAAESVSIDECLATGVLRVDPGSYLFRHELARDAVLQAMPPTRLMSLHRLVLQALLSSHTSGSDAARLAHHADAAGDAQAVQQWAAVAAREAATRGAHRQAAEHWARALRHGRAGAERARLLDDYAVEAQMCGGLDAAIAALREAVALWREQGQAGSAAISLARLARWFVLGGRNAEGEAALLEAQALVAGDANAPASGVVRRCAAAMRMLDRDCDEAIALATVSLAQAEHESDERSIVQLLITLGCAHVDSNRFDAGLLHLERALALAERLGSDFLVGQVLANLGSSCGEAIRLDLAETYLRRGIAFGAEHDLDAARLYQLAWLALVLLMRGHWDEASAAAHEVVADRRATPIARIVALIALGRLRARRGDPGVWTALDEARDLALRSGTLQRVAPMHAARAEAAWLEGRTEEIAREATASLPLALAKRQAGFAAELLLWCQRGAAQHAVPAFCEHHPFALEAAGRWQEAAQAWRALGCPYETARAWAEGDETSQRAALTTFESLGARPMVERLRHRLRAAGVRGLPRGPRSSTLQHPAGLTGKELAVLALLATGLRNKEIAVRLSRSARTIEHHLEAVFAKLGVATRAEAVSAAYRLGIVDTNADAHAD
jgi:DNA-binding CsgD family transcriptional regulator/tetratricopeptide (TPR) repeat protein